jgi:hypothetical protein
MGFEVDNAEWRQVYERGSALPWDPVVAAETWGEEAWGIDLGDDVADIYRDLKPALDALDTNDDTLLPGLVWSWRFNWEAHSGDHARTILRALAVR